MQNLITKLKRQFMSEIDDLRQQKAELIALKQQRKTTGQLLTIDKMIARIDQKIGLYCDLNMLVMEAEIENKKSA